MLKRILAVAVISAALLCPATSWAADAKKAVTLDAGGASLYRAGEIYGGTIAAGARDSTRLVDTRNFKQLWVALYVKASTAAGLSQPYRIAFQAVDFACMDSAGAGEYLKGYSAGDTAQNLRVSLAAADVVGATTDTLCREPWMPTGIRRTSTSGTLAQNDTTFIGQNDTTWVSAAKVQPNELLIMMLPRRANQGTTSQTFLSPAVYKFPISDLNGVFFRARYLQLRFRNLSEASITIRCRLELYKD